MARSAKTLSRLILLVAVACSSSCAWSIGSDDEVVHESPTIAQELRELEEAKEEGLLSEEEYQATRARILDGRRGD